MKLYTEETLEKAISTAIYQYGLWLENEQNLTSGKVVIKRTELKKQVIDALTPIELPSDEEIKQYSIGYALVNEDVSDKLDNYLVTAIHIDGAMWLKKQILNQNK